MNSNHCHSSLPDTTHMVRLSWIVGCILSSIGYGALLVLGHACYVGLRRRDSQNGENLRLNRNRALIVYVIFTLILGTVAEIVDINTTVNSALDDVCFFQNLQPPNPYLGRFDIIFLLINVTTDGLLVWRCYTVCGGIRGQRGWFTLLWVLPFIVYIAMLCVGITVVTRYSIVNGGGGFSKVLTPLQGGITAFLNVLITICIIILILHYRRITIEALGQNHPLPYLNVMTVLIESASLTLVVDVFAIVGFLKGTLGNVASQIWMPMQPIASLLIIYRVSQGSDYFHRQSEDLSTLKCEQAPQTCTEQRV